MDAPRHGGGASPLHFPTRGNTDLIRICHMRETERPASGHARAARFLLVVLVLVTLTVTGCSKSGSVGGGKPSSNNAEAVTFGFVDVCESFHAGAYAELIDDPDAPKPETDVDDAKAGWSACSWKLRQTVLSVQFTAPERLNIDGIWGDWTRTPGYGTWKKSELDDPDAWDRSDVQVTKDDKTNPVAAVVALKRGNLGLMIRCVVWDRATTTAKLVAISEAAASDLADKAKRDSKSNRRG